MYIKTANKKSSSLARPVGVNKLSNPSNVASDGNIALKRKPFRPTSLNINARHINDMKIREENIRIAKRLYDK